MKKLLLAVLLSGMMGQSYAIAIDDGQEDYLAEYDEEEGQGYVRDFGDDFWEGIDTEESEIDDSKSDGYNPSDSEGSHSQNRDSIKDEFNRQNGQTQEAGIEELVDAVGEFLLSEDGMFAKLKKDAPQIIATEKQYRRCLQNAQSKSMALHCQQQGKAKVASLQLGDDTLDGDLNREINSWSASEKRQHIAKVDKNIALMESQLPCVQQASNFAEAFYCANSSKGSE